MNTVIEKIRAEVERIMKSYDVYLARVTKEDFLNDLDNILYFLSDLEKECEDFPTTDEEMAKFLATHPKVEVPEKYKTPDWMFEKSEKPTTAEGLEEEIDKFLNETGAPYCWCNDDEQKDWCTIIARHFYELGRQSKPKVSEGLDEEAESCWRIVFPDGGIETTKMALTHDEFMMCARHFAQWGAEHSKIDVTDFCKPIDPGIAQCIAEHFWEMLGEDEKPVPKELEEGAKDYRETKIANGHFFKIKGTKPLCYLDDLIPAFIAGAKWQKEQMMKEAVEGKIVFLFNGDVAINIGDTDKYKLGDKVRIVIVKED